MLPQGSNGSGYYPEQFYPTNGGRLPGSTDSLRRQASFEVQLPLFNRQLQPPSSSSSPKPPPSKLVKSQQNTPNGQRQPQNGQRQSQNGQRQPQKGQRPAQNGQRQGQNGQQKVPLKDERPDVLVTLAETYFSRAHLLGPAACGSMETIQAQMYYKLMATGLGCLESVLKFSQPPRQRWKLQPKTEVAVRLRLATVLFEETENTQLAEEVLHKGILVAGRNNFLDMKYAMQHLLVRILHKDNAKAAFSMLSTISNDAESKDAHTWMYSFRLLRATLLMDDPRGRDLNGALTALRSVASHAHKRSDSRIYILAMLLEAALYLLSGPQQSEAAQKALSKAAMVPTSTDHPQQLSLFAASLNVICAVQQGNSALATQKLQELHEYLSPKSLQDWIEQFYMPVNSTREGFEPDLLVFNWFGKQEVMVFGYFLSAMAFYQKNAVENEKAERFLDEGIKKVDRLLNGSGNVPLSVGGAAGKMLWRRLTKAGLQMYKCFLLCGRSKWEDAKKLVEAIQLTMNDLQEDPFANHLYELFQYLRGTVAQATGDLSSALVYYKSIHSNETEIGLMAGLNAAVILRGDEIIDIATSDQLLLAAEKPCLESKNKQLVAAFLCARATASQELVPSKKFLSQSLDLAKGIGNNQIVFICLAFMSHRFFANIVSDQAEKATRAAYVNAKRCHDSLWQTVTGEMLADCLSRKGDHEDSFKQRSEVHTHKIAVAENLGHFRHAAPQYEEPTMIDQHYQQPLDPNHYDPNQYYYPGT